MRIYVATPSEHVKRLERPGSRTSFMRRLREDLADVVSASMWVSYTMSRWVGDAPDKPLTEAFWLDSKLAQLIDRAQEARKLIRPLVEMSHDPGEAWVQGLVAEDGKTVNW